MVLWALALAILGAWIFAGRRAAAPVAVAGWAAITLLHLLLPGLAARMVGGSLSVWLVIGGAGALVWGYTRLLRALRRRAAPEDGPPTVATRDDASLSDAELDRYARHLVLREIGGPGQMRMKRASVLIVGAGGLGAPVCLYLAAAGVGRITIADDDAVSLSNLQRQVIFATADVGRNKAEAAADAMAALNGHLRLAALDRRITDDDVALIGEHDLVIDGTDSFAAREAVNRACVAAGVPLVAGAIAQWEGQVTLYDPARGGPCLSCVFPDPPAPGQALPCAEAGVVGALPGVVGSLMALEAIKHLAGVTASGAGQGLRGRMLIFDGLWGETRTIAVERRPDCPVCGPRYSSTSGA
ncbi:molybdopterin-synthase adenylyltransferase MoeB [Paracoccus sp. TK19116]|uniref:Molybdopterin-synthase adenylyltransferase MoeB n=1 Tax=Paracoccus albicereus TaxID=2922394 RepID=A0ABT1MTC1_9RHOB|nr:molybdopterin-synthase adenylyltransferase MoeB [Paracoccus albicereus]MCQ0971555.1 molybdopterin-synthase adenylyltransferase MoeB [Paracoccus albicereus]